MEFFFEVIAGPHRGQVFKVKNGTGLGRSQGEVLLKDDNKISSLHARVELNSQGKLYLVDQNSANGLKYQGRRVRRILLEPYVEFSVGKTTIKVVTDAKIDASKVVGAGAAASAGTKTSRPKEEHWLDVLKSQTPRLRPSPGPAPPFGAFQPALELAFKEGVQTDRTVVLTFGPREFGSDTLDFELEDLMAPPVAFRIEPHAEGPVFKTDHPKLVSVNGQALPEKTLVPGDRIRIGQTLIVIGYYR